MNRFTIEDQELQHIYDNANALKVGSRFTYVGINYTVTGFTRTGIIATCGNGKDERFAAIDFEGYITEGFIAIL